MSALGIGTVSERGFGLSADQRNMTTSYSLFFIVEVNPNNFPLKPICTKSFWGEVKSISIVWAQQNIKQHSPITNQRVRFIYREKGSNVKNVIVTPRLELTQSRRGKSKTKSAKIDRGRISSSGFVTSCWFCKWRLTMHTARVHNRWMIVEERGEGIHLGLRRSKQRSTNTNASSWRATNTSFSAAAFCGSDEEWQRNSEKDVNELTAKEDRWLRVRKGDVLSKGRVPAITEGKVSSFRTQESNVWFGIEDTFVYRT